jgi:hypothetical protein
MGRRREGREDTVDDGVGLRFMRGAYSHDR